MSDYNGWKNKETWLVNVWCMHHIAEYFADWQQFHVEPNELEEVIIHWTEEYEALSQVPAGLLSDFISTCWGEVDWHSLADHLNDTLKEMEE